MALRLSHLDMADSQSPDDADCTCLACKQKAGSIDEDMKGDQGLPTCQQALTKRKINNNPTVIPKSKPTSEEKIFSISKKG